MPMRLVPCPHMSSLPPIPTPGFPPDQRNGDKEFVIRRAATNRVLNVLRHWVSKHAQVGGSPGAPSAPRRTSLAPRERSGPSKRWCWWAGASLAWVS